MAEIFHGKDTVAYLERVKFVILLEEEFKVDLSKCKN
jgi:hypothetical protein